MWHPPGAPQLDLPAALARLGHVSLTIDRLGYDASGHPDGWRTCLGAQADVTQQLVDKLRSGDYSAGGTRPVSFSTVVLAGHDAGATIADIAAYSYQRVDALVHFNWAEQGFTDAPQRGYVETLPICGSGGQPAEQGPPARSDPAGGPSGYVQFLTDDKIREEQRNTEPDVVDRLMRLWNRIPCGEFALVPEVLAINMLRLPEIRIPVLYGYTEHEFLWTQEGLAQQASHYRNSEDLTTVVIRDAGHFPQFSRVASTFHSTIAEWLRSRRLLSAEALTADGCPAANPTHAGSAGADRLRGTAGPENLVGRAGRDTLSGDGGDDCLRGGTGNDRIDAADAAHDRVDCGPGRDSARVDGFDAVRRCEVVRRDRGRGRR
jgi:hypothetical protein